MQGCISYPGNAAIAGHASICGSFIHSYVALVSESGIHEVAELSKD